MATATADPRELEAEAGPATGEMPPPDAPPPPELDEIQVDGSTELDQLELFKMGGKAPTHATIKFVGGRVKLVHGQGFKKGDRVRFSGEAVVNSVAQRDEHDSSTGIVVDCEQRHEARVVDLQVDSVS